MGCQGYPAEDYGLFVLGNLDGPPSEEIAEHLAAKCPVCTEEVAHYRIVWSQVAAVTPIVNPSRKLRSRVIQSVGGRVSWWAAPLPLLAGAAALLAAVAGGWFMLQRSTPVPVIAFSPAYRVEISAPGAVQTITRQIPVPVEKTIEKT